MLNRPLVEQLQAYTAFDAVEHDMLQRMIAFVQQYPDDHMSRDLQVGHITGSAWILDRNMERALLTHHRKLDKWLQLGGHAEGESRIVDVCRREAEEESGLSSIVLADESIFSVDIHLIPEHKGFPAHYHLDVRFLFFADPEEPLQITNESKDLKWIALKDITALNNDASMQRMVQQTILLKQA